MVEIGPGDLVVVLGQGMIGQAAARLARLRGGYVLAVDPIEERRTIAAAHSADEVASPPSPRVLEAVRRLKSTGADAVIDTTGRASLFASMVELIRPRGTIKGNAARSAAASAFALRAHSEATAEGDPNHLNLPHSAPS